MRHAAWFSPVSGTEPGIPRPPTGRTSAQSEVRARTLVDEGFALALAGNSEQEGGSLRLVSARRDAVSQALRRGDRRPRRAFRSQQISPNDCSHRISAARLSRLAAHHEIWRRVSPQRTACPSARPSAPYSEIEVAQEADWNAQTILERGLRMLDFLEQRRRVTLGDEEFINGLTGRHLVADEKKARHRQPGRDAGMGKWWHRLAIVR